MSEAPPKNASPRRLALMLSYDGGAFAGWQLQRGRHDIETIQGALERRLADVLGESVRLNASGRTDAGVHALGQVAHFDTASTLPTRAIQHALNNSLPSSLCVRSCADVAREFDARRSAILRTYTYRLVLAPPREVVLSRGSIGCSQGAHDLDVMREAAALIPGKHEFAGFRSSNCEAKRTRLTIERADLTALDETARSALALPDGVPALLFTISSRSFLMHMVRRLVGALAMTGRGKLSPSDIAMSLASGQPPPHVLPMPPSGLVLHRVDYPVDPFAVEPEVENH